MSRFVRLDFTLTEYAEDGDTKRKEVEFSGHAGWQKMMFQGEKPTEREIKLLADLSRILDELAKDA